VLIALLSTTLDRVHGSSKKLFLIERAKLILNIERTYCSKIRLNKLKGVPTRYICNYKVKEIGLNIEDKLRNIEAEPIKTEENREGNFKYGENFFIF
jgi:hypothetical protein